MPMAHRTLSSARMPECAARGMDARCAAGALQALEVCLRYRREVALSDRRRRRALLSACVVLLALRRWREPMHHRSAQVLGARCSSRTGTVGQSSSAPLRRPFPSPVAGGEQGEAPHCMSCVCFPGVEAVHPLGCEPRSLLMPMHACMQPRGALLSASPHQQW
jgi:hypothetical protein